MNICFYTMGRWETIGAMLEITVPNKLDYCKRHGYSFHFEEWDGGIFPGFARLPVLMHLLKCGYYDWIMWLGSDALITNPSIPLESLVDPDYGIVLATDFTQIQLDSFLIQRDHNGLKIMERVWEHRDQPIGPWYEQSTLDVLMRLPEFEGTVKIIPQRRMNSYQYRWYRDWTPYNARLGSGKDCQGNDGAWQPGDFIFHVPGIPYVNKLQALRQVIHLNGRKQEKAA